VSSEQSVAKLCKKMMAIVLFMLLVRVVVLFSMLALSLELCGHLCPMGWLFFSGIPKEKHKTKTCTD
jgi:hypothetical protein